MVRFGRSTIERWYYRVRSEQSAPIEVLRRKVRCDNGDYRSLDAHTKELIAQQYAAHPSWSYQLHADNIRALLQTESPDEVLPSYWVIRRYMQSCGMFKTKKTRTALRTPFLTTEVRSYEADYVGALWHLDFHHCSLQVLTKEGAWRTPRCLAVLDDHSRLGCHVQWYLEENTRSLVHALSQALQKRGLPRALMSDNGGPMLSEEFQDGLQQLGILHETTLPHSPYQNGKQERFFGVLEGRLIAMLEGCRELTLQYLNDATFAWLEQEYNRANHEELKESPLSRYLKAKDITRESPSSANLREAFRRDVWRTQRRSDGTLTLDGIRFEIPGHYRQLRRLRIRHARWDYGLVHLVDPDTGRQLCRLYPLDKSANADAQRRRITASPTRAAPQHQESPLLRKLMADYAATGSPPAYIPENEDE